MRMNPTVLLVDDDPDLLRLLSMRLHAAGLNVRTASGGEEALASIKKSRPQAVVTDLRMAGLDGMTLFDRVRQVDANMPVIVLTAHGSIPDAIEATRRGVFGYLTKPCEAHELIALIRRATARFTLDLLSEFVEQVSVRDPAARQMEIERLQGLDPMDASDRLKLACLLSVEGASFANFMRAQALLDGLAPLFGDPGTRLYAQLLQRTVALEIARNAGQRGGDEPNVKLAQASGFELDPRQVAGLDPAGSPGK